MRIISLSTRPGELDEAPALVPPSAPVRAAARAWRTLRERIGGFARRAAVQIYRARRRQAQAEIARTASLLRFDRSLDAGASPRIRSFERYY